MGEGCAPEAHSSQERSGPAASVWEVLCQLSGCHEARDLLEHWMEIRKELASKYEAEIVCGVEEWEKKARGIWTGEIPEEDVEDAEGDEQGSEDGQGGTVAGAAVAGAVLGSSSKEKRRRSSSVGPKSDSKRSRKSGGGKDEDDSEYRTEESDDNEEEE